MSCLLVQTIPLFTIDDDLTSHKQPKPELLLTVENASLLSVNQLLESVCSLLFT